jgi:hypothetical protein
VLATATFLEIEMRDEDDHPEERFMQWVGAATLVAIACIFAGVALIIAGVSW